MMKAKPKSLALAKFQQAGQLAIAKNKAAKAETKKEKGIDAVQVGSIAAAVFMVFWIIASTVVSAVFTVRYMGIVEEDQAWYLLEGSARTAAAEAQSIMEAATQVKSALISAIDYGLIKTSYDYAAIESTLVPTMALKPYVHSFDMVFTDRTAGLKISHREEENGRQLLLQSNGADCYLLGTQGCADLGVKPNSFPVWQSEAMYLNLSIEGQRDAELISQAQLIAISKQAGPAEQWLLPPVLDGVQGSGENKTWYPVVRLLFRQPLPAAWAPQQETLCGRISLQVAALSRDHLRDSQLGDGKTFLVDASGTILSAIHIQDTLAVDSVGNLQMRRITELADSSWTGSIAGAFQNDRVEAMQVQEGWLAVVVHPLPMPLNMFAIVVVSRAENSSFQDSSIFQSMIVLMAFASVPYVVVFVTLSIVFFSANAKVEFKVRKSIFHRMAGGVTDFAAAQGAKLKHRTVVRHRPTSRGGDDGPLFTKEMEGMGRKISQTSILSAGEIYDAEDRPLAVQPRKTYMMNDAYFEADRSCKGYCVRCVRCFCSCCRGRSRY